MQHSKTALDPLWQCLCPSWPQANLSRPLIVAKPTRPLAPQCLRTRIVNIRHVSSKAQLNSFSQQNDALIQPIAATGNARFDKLKHLRPRKPPRRDEEINFEQESTPSLYGRLGAAAVKGKQPQCRRIAEYLVKERREKPSLQMYNALITSNISNEHGAAWRVSDLLEEMEQAGLQPDAGTCHAVLKVLAVHVDHLLRTDVLEYMERRWFALSEDGAHDVVAGLLREGLFEQALQRLEAMQIRTRFDGWLWHMVAYMFCDAGEIEEAYRVVRSRRDAGALIHRNLWYYLLDKASEARHHEATSMVWMNQVQLEYLNPSSGVCLNVLATAAHAGDAVMGTEVFAHLSKRGTAFQPIHYELLISTYLAADPPDLRRAISILTIMPLEKLEPTSAETRSLYRHLRDNADLVKQSFAIVQELHAEGRTIPIALLNLLIECYVEQQNLDEAMNLYKLIHTLNPVSEGLQKSFANIETFNLLLKGCRLTNPPDEHQASFLVSELLALRKTPTSMTYDRLILVFVEAGKTALQRASAATDHAAAEDARKKGYELFDWAFRHFSDMQPLGWMPRFGTIEQLAIQLATAGDQRCWDVLQVAEDEGDKIEGFTAKGKWVRKNVEEAWANAVQGTIRQDDTETKVLE